MARRKDPIIPDALLDQLLSGADPKTAFDPGGLLDGPKGFPETIVAVFPQTTVQTCIVHLLRHSLDVTSFKDRKAVAAALKAIHQATDADAAQKALTAFDEGEGGRKYAAIGQSWRRAWGEVVPFFAFPEQVRKIVYTTNAIEALNLKLRRSIRAGGHFPSDEARDFRSPSGPLPAATADTRRPVHPLRRRDLGNVLRQVEANTRYLRQGRAPSGDRFGDHSLTPFPVKGPSTTSPQSAWRLCRWWSSTT